MGVLAVVLLGVMWDGSREWSVRRRYGRRLLEGWVGGAKVELGVPSFLVLVEVTSKLLLGGKYRQYTE